MSRRTTYCGSCDEVTRYDINQFDQWFCHPCGFAIDCVECGQTMSADHECTEEER